jgi:Na+/melibiose symporter-like transporter
MAGLALEFIGFPQGSQITPSAAHIFNLAMVQGPLVAFLMIIPFAIFSMYKIDRFKHQEIIAELENRS